MAVADFYAEFMERLHRLGIDVHIWTMPCEIANAVPFEQDRAHAQYDRVYAARFRRVLVQATRVLNEFRARFIGKVSPVHFLLGQLRSRGHALFRPHRAAAQGRHAQRRQLGDGGSLFARSLKLRLLAGQRRLRPRGVLRLCLSGAGGLRRHAAANAGAFYDKNVGQFMLPYDAVRQARDPDALLLGFLQETYAAAADLAKWDRKALERSG